MSAVLPVGTNATRLWGLTARERLSRIALMQGHDFAADASGGALLANVEFVFDPAWLRFVAERPDHVVTFGGVPVLAHCTRLNDRLRLVRAMKEGSPGEVGAGLTEIRYEDAGSLENEALRKRERPFLGDLTPATVRALERESYFGAYKGVTDMLTKYLWPEWALVLTRWAAKAGITPNQVTAIGAALCVLATFLFYHGWYWTGLAAGLAFMVLDTVDGKLARCTITSSWWGNVFDHGIDLVHPPFWWWAWGMGLYAYGRPLPPETFWWTLAVIVGGYVVQRAIEGAFIALFKIHIHVWRPFDSRFRLITARRNPNMVILLVFLLVGRPDWGLVAVAVWTLASLLVHIVQLVQALAARAGGLAGPLLARLKEAHMNETIRRFGYPETLVAEYEHWVVLLRPAQPTLGSLILAAKSDATAFSALDPAAIAGLHATTVDIERTLKDTVGWAKINYLMLMMVDPHVHFHVIPRYEGERSGCGLTIADAGWPKVPALGEAVALEPAQIEAMTGWLRSLWPSGR